MVESDDAREGRRHRRAVVAAVDRGCANGRVACGCIAIRSPDR